jgi:Mor family transcriptional regulator
MICPKCSSKDTRVTVTEAHGPQTWRYCRCLNCSFKFKTIEKYAVPKRKKPGPKLGSRMNGGSFRTGSLNHASVLTEKDIRRLRSLAQRGKKQKDLAKIFGISESHVSRIIRRLLWKSI